MSSLNEKLGGITFCEHGNMTNDLNYCGICNAIDSLNKAVIEDSSYLRKQIEELEHKVEGLEEENENFRETCRHQERLRIEAENDKIKLGERLVVWNRIGRDITQSCEGHEEHDVKSLLNQIKDVSDNCLFETKLKIEIERDKYYKLYVNACKNLEAN